MAHMQAETLNGVTSTGATPLHLCAARGTPQVVAALLESPDVNPNIRDNNGKTPVDRAARSNSQIRDMIMARGGRYMGSPKHA